MDLLSPPDNYSNRPRTSLTAEEVSPILSYLSLAPSSILPTPPLAFLTVHLASLPPSLLSPFSAILSPRDRAKVRPIKARRLLWAETPRGKRILSAQRGKRRWPLLWERMGGEPVQPGLDGDSARQDDDGEDDDDEDGEEGEEGGGARLPERAEQAWATREFIGGQRQEVRKLGGLLRGLEEEREGERVRARKREERRGEEEGEEFDESDEEEEGPGEPSKNGTYGQTDSADGPMARQRQRGEPLTAAEEAEVRQSFERRLLELFLDGLDTIDYDPIDYVEPPGGDPIAQRDEEDAYFDDQSPGLPGQSESAGLVSVEAKHDPVEVSARISDTGESQRTEHQLKGKSVDVVQGRLGRDWDAMDRQNGQGEYDY